VVGTVARRSGVGRGRDAISTLPPFKPERPPPRRALVKALFLAFCTFLGFFYGFIFAVFPPSMMVYMALPVVLLAIIVIWALPDQGRAPTALLSGMFFAYAVVWVMWPNYLAIQLPGLPWISMRRVFGFPMALIFLICLSMSGRFRTELKEGLNGLPLLWKLLTAFVAIQWLTIPLSSNPFGSLNIVLNTTILNVSAFFIGAWLFLRPGKATRWADVIAVTVVILSILGGLEFQKQKVLWADYIPSFLAVTDESVQRTLSGQVRDGAYRTVTTFSVPLSMAEYLALATPFVLRRLVTAKGFFRKLLYVAVDVLILSAAVWTGARLGIVGWIVAHAVFGCLWSYRRWRTDRSDVLGPALALGLPAFALAFGVAMFTVPAVKYRTIGGGSTSLSDSARKEQFRMAVPKVLSNPLGNGAGQSGTVLQYRTASGMFTVDSYVITILLDFGILGFLIFSAALLYPMIQMAIFALRKRSEELDLALAAASALAVYINVRLVLSQDDNSAVVYMLLGLTTALAARIRAYDAAYPTNGAVPVSAAPPRRSAFANA